DSILRGGGGRCVRCGAIMGVASFFERRGARGGAKGEGRRGRRFLDLFVLSACRAALFAASCGPDEGVAFDEDAPMDEAGEIRSSESASTVAEQTLSLGVEFPTDVVLREASVIAKQALTMNDRVQVGMTSATNRLGLTVWHDAQVGDL